MTFYKSLDPTKTDATEPIWGGNRQKKNIVTVYLQDQNLKIKLIEKFINVSEKRDQISIIAMWDGSELNFMSKNLNLISIKLNYETLEKNDQKKYIIHEKDKHPTALANSIKAELLYKYIQKNNYLSLNN